MKGVQENSFRILFQNCGHPDFHFANKPSSGGLAPHLQPGRGGWPIRFPAAFTPQKKPGARFSAGWADRRCSKLSLDSKLKLESKRESAFKAIFVLFQRKFLAREDSWRPIGWRLHDAASHSSTGLLW